RFRQHKRRHRHDCGKRRRHDSRGCNRTGPHRAVGLRGMIKRRAYLQGAPTLVETHMQTARPFVAATSVTAADCNGSLRRRSRGLLRAIMAAVAAAALATGVLLFAPPIVAQPTSNALGELLVGKAALGDWRTDAPLVRRKITELPPPYAT